ncbi:hypothetical protein [Runella sp.]|uniref:hypothetical protein n=1 Tax=Runella sp. TaxID=1960881 RepID=UPI003D10076F
MDDEVFKLALYILVPAALAVSGYGMWQSRVKLRQMKELPSVMQAAGLQLFANQKMHESFQFLPNFKQPEDIKQTRCVAKGRINDTDIVTFIYDEKRSKTTHPILVLIAALPQPVPQLGIYTRSTIFGPITPSGQQVFETKNAELDKAFRITAASKADFDRLVTPELQKYLLQNQDIAHIEIAEKAVALFNTDSRFFQLVTTNGIPSKSQFERRLRQVSELQKIIEKQPAWAF